MALIVKQSLILFIGIIAAVAIQRFMMRKFKSTAKVKNITTAVIVFAPISLVTLWLFFPGAPYSY